MNIFVLSSNTKEAAIWHVDKHIVKMPLESAQMLCTSLHHHGFEAPYKPVHVKHPCTLWTQATRSNYLWLCDLGIELCKEFTYRYGKVHSSEAIINLCLENRHVIPDGPLTDFAQAMPDECKRPNAIDAYREFYRKHKAHLATWKARSEPGWYREELSGV